MANSGVQVVKKPKQPFAYQGNQVIINTDRVVMQSKKDSILLFAKEHMSFSCNGSIHFDTSSDDKSYLQTQSGATPGKETISHRWYSCKAPAY